MPTNRPSTAIWAESAAKIGCDIPTVKAIFEVEAAGRFYETSGKLPRRFEPHHFPSAHRSTIGFAVAKGQAAWRASLALSTSVRRAMFDKAEAINPEATYDASSWGAPQIMGFNAELSGFDDATDLVTQFEESADNQIRGFVNFVINAGLATHMRSQNWLAFASGYNGNGQAAVYSAKIESAYRRQSGGQASASTLRVGSRGTGVEDLQVALVALGYEITVDGHYGNETLKAVRAFQEEKGLVTDGIAGAMTQRAIEAAGAPAIVPTRNESTNTVIDERINQVFEYGKAAVGSGGVVTLLSSLGENTQQLVIGGTILGVIVLGAIWMIKKK